MIKIRGRKGITLVVLSLMMVIYTLTIASVPTIKFSLNFPVVLEQPANLETVFSLQTYTGTKTVIPFASPDNSYENLQQLLYTADESLYVEIYGINNPYILKEILETDTLTLDSNWNESAQIRLKEGCVLPFHTDFNHQYIGVKKGYMLGLIQVASLSNNGIKIMDFALNLTEGNPIIAGER